LSKFKPVKVRKVIKVLSTLGFVVIRQKGSHMVMKHEDGRVTVIPVHEDEDLGRGILLEIIKDMKLTKEEFVTLLDKT
jgi:Predicted periplasmic or secreted lipoprotein